MRLVDAAADLLLGACCAGCGTPGLGVCPQCRTRLIQAPQRLVRPLWGTDLPPVFSALRYQPPVSRLVVAHKDQAALQLVRPLAELLTVSVRASLSDTATDSRIALVPVPSDRQTVQRRGYDHADALARATGRLVGLPTRRLLARTGAVLDQHVLNRAQRWSAQQASMTAVPGNSTVVLIDDVFTTGATACEAVRALAAAGHRVLAVAVVADTALRAESSVSRPVSGGVSTPNAEDG